MDVYHSTDTGLLKVGVDLIVALAAIDSDNHDLPASSFVAADYIR